MKKIIVILFASSILLACQQTKEKQTNGKASSADSVLPKTKISYANFFTVDYQDGMKVVQLKNPDDTAMVLTTYYLGTDKNIFEEKGYAGQFIKTPLERISITSSTQAAYLNAIDRIDKVKGVSEAKYFKNPQIKTRFDKGEIKDIGPSTNINYEVLLNLNSEVFFISLFRNNSSKKVEELGLQPCLDLGYLENSPLGRAEWIKFFALFFNKEKAADSIFHAIEKDYLATQALVKNVESQPTIISGKKFGQIWHVPGGKSYMAKFFEDAGVDYLWKENESTASIPLDFEAVYAKGARANFWIFKQLSHGQYSLEELASEFSPYKDFEAFRNEKIIYCNVDKKPYYEDGVMEPHLILADLVKLVHPDLLPEYQTKYFEFLGHNE